MPSRIMANWAAVSSIPEAVASGKWYLPPSSRWHHRHKPWPPQSKTLTLLAERLVKTNRCPQVGSAWSWERTRSDSRCNPRRRSTVEANQIFVVGGGEPFEAFDPPPGGGRVG